MSIDFLESENLVRLPPAEKKKAFESMPDDFKELLKTLTATFGKPEGVWFKEVDNESQRL